MSLDMSNTDKLSEFRLEARRLGIRVEPPSINRSGPDFEVHDGAIRYALGAVKGVGMAAMERLVECAGEGSLSSTSASSRGASTRARSTSACWRASPARAPSTSSTRTAPA